MKKIASSLSLFFLFFGFMSFLSPSDANAQACTERYSSYISSCEIKPSGDCASKDTVRVYCQLKTDGSCKATVQNAICAFVDGVCLRVMGNPRSVEIDCGGSVTSTPTPGGGNTPTPGGCVTTCENITECKQAGNCPGTQGAECGVDNNGNTKYLCSYRSCTTICPTNTPTPRPTSTPTTTPPVAYCQNILAYNSNWVLMTNAQLQQTKAGDNLYYCVAGYSNYGSGSFDMARFTINGTLNPNTTLLRPGTTTDYCQTYQVPANTYNFSVSGEVHHTTAGWVN